MIILKGKSSHGNFDLVVILIFEAESSLLRKKLFHFAFDPSSETLNARLENSAVPSTFPVPGLFLSLQEAIEEARSNVKLDSVVTGCNCAYIM